MERAHSFATRCSQAELVEIVGIAIETLDLTLQTVLDFRVKVVVGRLLVLGVLGAQVGQSDLREPTAEYRCENS